VVFAGSRDGLAAGGKAVIVCDVEVIEDVVLPVLAIFAFCVALVVRLSRRNFSRVKLYRETRPLSSRGLPANFSLDFP
jgi:bacteriorhodopsin